MEEDASKVANRTDAEVFGHYRRDRFLPVASWAMYDFANTIYSAIVVTFFLTLYVTKEHGGSNLLVGATTFLSMIFSALISPFLGALPDRTGKTKQYLIIATTVCCACTFLLSMPDSPAWIIVFYFAANVCYQVSYVFYDSLLPVVATPKKQAMVSGLGVALGYIGVILGLLMAWGFIGLSVRGPDSGGVSWRIRGIEEKNSDNGTVWADLLLGAGEGGRSVTARLYCHDRSGAERETGRGQALLSGLPCDIAIEPVDGSGLRGSVRLKSLDTDLKGFQILVSYRRTFMSAGVLFLLFSLPLFFWVPERSVRDPKAFTLSIFVPSTLSVLSTARELASSAWNATFRRKSIPSSLAAEAWKKRNVFFFLLGNFLCVDVLNTAIQWFSKYVDKVFSFTSEQVMLFGIALSSCAFIGGIVMGKATQRLGARRAIIASSLLLLGTLLVTGLFASATVVVATIMAAGACGLAGLWVAGRKLLIELAPPDKIGEYFGFYGITIKISVAGTMIFSLISDFGEKTGTWICSLAGSLPGGADMHWNYRLAILAQVVMLVPGILCLVLVYKGSADGD